MIFGVVFGILMVVFPQVGEEAFMILTVPRPRETARPFFRVLTRAMGAGLVMVAGLVLMKSL